MNMFRRFTEILRDYCLNSSLAGLPYTADGNRYHISERIFWILCLILSGTGSYYLIQESMENFQENSISMVVENLLPREMTAFPSLAVCEMGFAKQEYPNLEALVHSLKTEDDNEYNYDVEDFLLRMLFHNLYNYGSVGSYCAPYKDCHNCVQCPASNYSQMAKEVRANCTELLHLCVWNGVPFDCCHYFQPLQTTLGNCFFLNSIQIVQKHGKQWLDMSVGWETGNGLLDIMFKKATDVFIINEEDIPHILLTTLEFELSAEGFHTTAQLNLQNMANDKSIRDIEPPLRKCRFPDETIESSSYKYYSYSICVTECLKMAQVDACNCTHYNIVYDEHDPTPGCDYDGLYCLDQNDLMFPQTMIMQPWRTNGLVCNCLPSCTEHEIKVVTRDSDGLPDTILREITISLQSLPTQRYRRQAVREKLDIVVSVGGIMGLFMGASILSLVELIYFFTVRLCGSAFIRRTSARVGHQRDNFQAT